MTQRNTNVCNMLDQRVYGKKVNPKYFGTHTYYTTTTLTSLKDVGINVGTYRLWDTNTTWKLLETSKGSYTWTIMDTIVNECYSLGIDVIYTLGQPPAWACGGSDLNPGLELNPQLPTNVSDWTNYVTVVATRYKGKIKYYETWNEPDNAGSLNTFSATGLVSLAQTAFNVIHSIDPNALLCCPGFHDINTGDFVAYLQAGGGAYMDAVSIHMYPNMYQGQQPEVIIQNMGFLRSILTQYDIREMPILITETGYGRGGQTLVDQTGATWPHSMWIGETIVTPTEVSQTSSYPNQKLQAGLNSNQQAVYLSRFYLSGIAAGADILFHYTTDSGNSSPYSYIDMVNSSNAITSAGTAVQNMMKYVLGSMFLGFQRTKDGIYAALFQSQSGTGYLILWTEDLVVQNFDLSRLAGTNKVVDLLGNQIIPNDSLYPGTVIPIPHVISSSDIGIGIPVVVTLLGYTNENLLSVWQDIDHKNEFVDLIYNGDLSLIEPSSNISYPDPQDGYSITTQEVAKQFLYIQVQTCQWGVQHIKSTL